MKDRLTTLWKMGETKGVAHIFEEYMKVQGVRKIDGRRRDNSNTYMIDGKSTSWNRVECYYHKDSEEFAEEDLLIVLRKRAGSYLIIARKGVRAFEVDYGGIKHYDEKLLKDIMEDHKALFDALVAE